MTLGNSIGKGKEGVVHEVTSHTSASGDKDPNHLLVKEFHANNANPQAEINHLRQAGQLHASGKDENDVVHAVISKQPGVKLTDTQTYKEAKRGAGKEAIKEKGAQLVGDAQLRHAETNGILHKCVVSMHLSLLLYLIYAFRDNHSGNVLFEEEEDPDHEGQHRLTKANFVDWGKAEQAPEKPSTGYTQEQKDKIVCYFPS